MIFSNSSGDSPRAGVLATISFDLSALPLVRFLERTKDLPKEIRLTSSP